MGFLTAIAKPAISVVLAFLLLQFGGAVPPEAEEDAFSRATTPPEAFLQFNADFSSMNLDTFMAWVNPSLGIVKNGVLLTKEEAQEEFRTAYFNPDKGNMLAINLHFNYGEFTGDNTYQADCWVEYKLREEGGENWYRFHNQFVFRIIDTRWYVIQSEYVPTEADLLLDYQNFVKTAENIPEWVSPFTQGQSETELAGVSTWPLLIGTTYGGEAELHPLEGKTPKGSKWRLADSIAAGKPVVLFFFSVQALSIAPPGEMEAQMEFLEGLYGKFGYRDLYIYGVTDQPLEVLEWMTGSGYSGFAPLLDEGSTLHATLNIDKYPYIVVIDSKGTVVALSKTWHSSSLSMIEDRIRDAIAGSNPSS